MPKEFADIEQIRETILELIASGKSLNKICEMESMPSRSTVSKWVREDEVFCTSIARAREEAADYFLDRQIELADEATIEDYQLRKFQADNLKWVAAKLQPKKYGDKAQTEVTNNVNITPAVSQLNTWLGQHGLIAAPGANAGTGKERPLLPATLHPQPGGYREAVVIREMPAGGPQS